MKHRTISLICVAALLLTLCACGTAKKAPDAQQTAENTGTTADETTETGGDLSAAADAGGWTWTKSEMDCLGYSAGDVDCYLSFERPENFKSSEEDGTGEQYRGYYFSPTDGEAGPDDSPYGIYACFMQGGYGAVKASFEEQVEGGLQERELGGRTVLFGELPADENTGSHAFIYYTSYSDDEWARIWIVLCDPEADGAFRSAFEQSLSFSK